MTRKIVIAAIIFIALAAGAVFYNYSQLSTEDIQTPVTAGSAILVSPLAYDFGRVVYGDVAKHAFKIKNTGGKNLEILKLSTSCGCTKAVVAEADKIIAPGEEIDMLVTFDPAVHKDDSDLGGVTRVIYIKTNDSASPETEVIITADVIRAGIKNSEDRSD